MIAVRDAKLHEWSTLEISIDLSRLPLMEVPYFSTPPASSFHYFSLPSDLLSRKTKVSV